jgi:insertion element IS1 protein InsB
MNPVYDYTGSHAQVVVVEYRIGIGISICGRSALHECHGAKRGRLILECDELWSLVGTKLRQKWIWLAYNRDTGEIVGMAIGARTKAMARKLWASLPGVYRQCAICYTDFWQAYAAILPSKRHRAVGK